MGGCIRMDADRRLKQRVRQASPSTDQERKGAERLPLIQFDATFIKKMGMDECGRWRKPGKEKEIVASRFSSTSPGPDRFFRYLSWNELIIYRRRVFSLLCRKQMVNKYSSSSSLSGCSPDIRLYEATFLYTWFGQSGGGGIFFV